MVVVCEALDTAPIVCAIDDVAGERRWQTLNTMVLAETAASTPDWMLQSSPNATIVNRTCDNARPTNRLVHGAGKRCVFQRERALDFVCTGEDHSLGGCRARDCDGAV